MRTSFALCFLVPVLLSGFACSPAEEESTVEAPPEMSAVENVDTSDLLPPLISEFAPQLPGPEPQAVQTLPQPIFRTPKQPENPTLADARAKSQFVAIDSRNPISNGVFERWEKPGPVNWDGKFTYKNPGDPPDPDIQMYPDTIEGGWALRFMPKGNYIEVWQDVKLPDELEGALVLDISAYVRNPVVKGFAIRLTYATPDAKHVAEVYPEQTGPEWTRYHARVDLPENVGRKSLRLYLTRDPSVDKSVIVDAVSVQVVGAKAAAAAPQA